MWSRSGMMRETKSPHPIWETIYALAAVLGLLFTLWMLVTDPSKDDRTGVVAAVMTLAAMCWVRSEKLVAQRKGRKG